MKEDVLVLDPNKLRKVRGNKTRRAVVEAAGNSFKEQQLLGWEKGRYRPRPQNLAALLRALNVTFEEIASPLRPTGNSAEA
jgi:transcriptional regulator with XRE-family HTH domain